jgi:hypothetical protein
VEKPYQGTIKDFKKHREILFLTFFISLSAIISDTCLLVKKEYMVNKTFVGKELTDHIQGKYAYFYKQKPFLCFINRR